MDDGDAGFLVWDAKKKEWFSVNLEGRTYMTMPWEAATPGESNGMADDMIVTPPGRAIRSQDMRVRFTRRETRTIRGPVSFAWGKGLARRPYSLSARDPSTCSRSPGWLRDMIKDGGFPLRTIDLDKAEKEELRSERVKGCPPRTSGSSAW